MKQRNMTSIYLCDKDKILLLHRRGSRVANDVWIGSAGGHFEETELNDAEACVLRELREELAIGEEQLWDLRLRYITLRHTAGEIRVNYYFFADILDGLMKELSSNEGELKWFDKSEIRKLEMPFTARFVMEHYISQGQFDTEIYGGIVDGTKVVFTALPEF